jgi:hypothetical protein
MCRTSTGKATGDALGFMLLLDKGAVLWHVCLSHKARKVKGPGDLRNRTTTPSCQVSQPADSPSPLPALPACVRDGHLANTGFANGGSVFQKYLGIP